MPLRGRSGNGRATGMTLQASALLRAKTAETGPKDATQGRIRRGCHCLMLDRRMGTSYRRMALEVKRVEKDAAEDRKQALASAVT